MRVEILSSFGGNLVLPPPLAANFHLRGSRILPSALLITPEEMLETFVAQFPCGNRAKGNVASVSILLLPFGCLYPANTLKSKLQSLAPSGPRNLSGNDFVSARPDRRRKHSGTGQAFSLVPVETGTGQGEPVPRISSTRRFQ